MSDRRRIDGVRGAQMVTRFRFTAEQLAALGGADPLTFELNPYPKLSYLLTSAIDVREQFVTSGAGVAQVQVGYDDGGFNQLLDFPLFTAVSNTATSLLASRDPQGGTPQAIITPSGGFDFSELTAGEMVVSVGFVEIPNLKHALRAQ